MVYSEFKLICHPGCALSASPPTSQARLRRPGLAEMDNMVGKHSVGIVGKGRLDDAVTFGDAADAKIMLVKVTVLVK